MTMKTNSKHLNKQIEDKARRSRPAAIDKRISKLRQQIIELKKQERRSEIALNQLEDLEARRAARGTISPDMKKIADQARSNR